MFRIKVCGITTVGDALAAAEAGVDAIGLNFYEGSPRCVKVARATEICAALGDKGPEVIALFVNSPLADIRRIVEQLPVSRIQLHGDEPFALIEQLAPRSVVRAVRCRDGESLMEAVARWSVAELPTNLAALLVDASHPQVYGGSGQEVARAKLGELTGIWGAVPWILAGGLTPNNVQQAIVEARPDGVDTASGVESAPGRKDARLMRAFVEAARAALAGLGQGGRYPPVGPSG